MSPAENNRHLFARIAGREGQDCWRSLSAHIPLQSSVRPSAWLGSLRKPPQTGLGRLLKRGPDGRRGGGLERVTATIHGATTMNKSAAATSKLSLTVENHTALFSPALSRHQG